MRTILQAFSIPDAYRGLTTEQIAYVMNPAKRRTNHSGRRSGKTYSVLRWLVAEWDSRPGQTSVFVATSQGHAMSIGWETFRILARDMGWKVEPNKAVGGFTFPNGFQLIFDGAKDRPSADRLRGWPKVWRVNIDECGAFSDEMLQYLVQSVVEPMLADTNGDLSLSGTPSPLGEGFYDDAMDLYGADFCWDARSNPHLAIKGEDFFEQVLANNGWKPDHPTFRREYLGERVKDSSVMIYKVGYEPYEPPPREGYTAMGVDIGWDDGFGFSVVRQRAGQPGVHVMEAIAESHMGFGRAAAVMDKLYREYKVSEIFVDTAGGGGRTLCESFALHYNLPAKPVKKAGVRNQIELVRSFLSAETMKGTRGKTEQLWGELRRMPWNDDRDGHREGYQDECINATQYALTGAGFTGLTNWEEEKTQEQKYWDEIEARKRRAVAERNGGKRRR